MHDLDRLLNSIRRDRLTDLLVEAVNHYSPSFAEGPAVRVFGSALKEAGIAHYKQTVLGPSLESKRANLVVELGPRPIELMWLGHLDTIPWRYEEDHGAVLEDDILYGLGAADMKGACVAAVEALCALHDSGLPLKRGLCVALVVGEEEYGDGAEMLTRTLAAPLTIVGEPTELRPCFAHYGYLECQLKTRGVGVHAALSQMRANAIHAMLSWMLEIIDKSNQPEYAGKLAINPREILGGADLFVSAEHCEALLDVHLPPDVDQQPVLQLIDQARAAVQATHPQCRFECEELFWAHGYELNPHEMVFASLERAYRAVDLPWRPGLFRSHSDANLLHDLGMRPVICGPGNLAVAHTRDEHISLSEVERAAGLYAAMFYEACVR